MEKQLPDIYTTRTTIIILILKVILLEIIIEGIEIAIRFSVNYFSPLENLTIIHTMVNYGSLFFLLIQLFVLIFLLLQWHNTYYEISHSEINIYNGILTVKKKIFPYVKADTVSIYQGIVGRIFNFGSIYIYSPSLKRDIYLTNIPKPHIIASFLQQQSDKQKPTIIMRRL